MRLALLQNHEEEEGMNEGLNIGVPALAYGGY